MAKAGLVAALVLTSFTTGAAVFLMGGSYSESFDGIGDGLPDGWSVRTGATADSLGTPANLVTEATSWGDSGGAFKNVASADELTSGASTASQAASTDRALGLRQGGSFGDPGAAFVFEIPNTTGLSDFTLSFNLQMLSVQTRSTTWTFDYRIGDTGDFVVLGSYDDPGVFGSTPITFTGDQLGAWNDQSSTIWFRIVALTDSVGTGSRDTIGIDDFALTFTAVPEPSGAGLALISGALFLLHTARRKS